MDEARLCGSSLPIGPIALPALGRSRPGPKNPTWLWWDSNPRPSDPQSDALTTALRGPVHFKLLLEGSIRSILPMGHSRYVYWVNKSENINLSTSSMIFFLLLTSSNYCRSTHYLWLQPLFWNSYWGMSHRCGRNHTFYQLSRLSQDVCLSSHI